MEFSQLRSFVEVARHGHLTRAADQLHLSQPAISAKIKSLEETLGATLFHRSSTGMALTIAGKHLLPHAQGVLEAVRHLRGAAKQLNGQVAELLRLGTVLDGNVVRAGELLSRSMREYPHIDIELHHLVSHQALASVRAGALDASFYFGPEPGPDLKAVPLRDIAYRVAIPRDWVTGRERPKWQTLVDRPWVVTPEGSSHRMLVLQMFADRGAQPSRFVEADNESLILNLVETGVGASLVRDELATPSHTAGRIAVLGGAPWRTRLWLVYPRGRESEPMLEALLKVMREVWHLGPEGPPTGAVGVFT